MVRSKFLQHNPNGINMIRTSQAIGSQMHHEEVHKMLATIKRVSGPSAKSNSKKTQKRVPISPMMNELAFCHEDAGGSSWEQGY